MRYINKMKMCLIIGLAAVAIPIAAYVGRTTPSVGEVQVEPAKHTASDHRTARKAALGKDLIQPQDYYDRRREYWERRLESDLDESDMDDEDSDKNDKADSEDSKDSGDREEDAIERRREYWRQRLDKEW